MPRFLPTTRTPPPPRHVTPQRGRETLEEHWAAQNAIDLAAHKRRHQEEWGAALLEAEDAPDEKARRGIFERAASRMTTIDTEVPEVRNAYAQYVESAMPYWTDRFARQAKDIKDRQIHDLARAEIDAAVDAGDVEGAAAGITRQLALEPENRIPLLQERADLPFAIAERAAIRAVSDKDLTGIRAATDALRGMALEGLSTEQVVARKKVLDVADRRLDEMRGSAQIELLLAASKAADLPADERYAEVERIKAAFGPLLRTPEETRATMNWLDAQAKGEPFTVDPRAEIEANRVIRGLNADSTAQEYADARKRILGLMPRLGSKTVDYIKELDTRLDEIMTSTVEYAVDVAETGGRIDPAYAPIMRRAVEKEIHRQKDAMSPADIVEYGAEIAVTLPAPEPELPATVLTAKRKFEADVLAGGPERDPETGETREWYGAEEYFNLALSMGPDWDKVSPTALRTALGKWPLAFLLYMPDEGKAAILDRARHLEGAFWDGTVLEGDITEGDREWIVEIAPLGQAITSEDIQEVVDYLRSEGRLMPIESLLPPGEVLSELGLGTGLAGMDDEELVEAYEQARTTAERRAIYDEAQRRENFGGTFTGGVP